MANAARIRLDWLDIRQLAQSDVDMVAAMLPKRYEHAQVFLRKEDRLRSIGAGLLMLRLGLRDERDLEYGARGKPSVAYLPSFNISHSGNYVVSAVAEEPNGAAQVAAVGVDVEHPRRGNLKVAKRVFLAEEIDWMQQEDPDLRFCRLWTCKEAVMKLFGEGLHMDPQSFSVMPLLRGGQLAVNGVEIHAVFDIREDHVLCAAFALR